MSPLNQFRKSALDSAAGHAGVCSTHGVTCAICSKIQDFKKPFKAAHWARKYARVAGWSYLKRWGWVCRGCVSSIPGPISQDEAAHQTRYGKPRTRGTKRVQIEINLK